MDQFLTIFFWFTIIVLIGYLFNFIGYLLGSAVDSIRVSMFEEKESSKYNQSIKDSTSYIDIDYNHVPMEKQEQIPHHEYVAYLLSQEWRTVADLRLKRDKYTCQYCGSKLDKSGGDMHIPNVHHLHYRNLKHEDISNDLVSLCKKCHIYLHSKYTLPEMEQEINIKRTISQF